MSSAHAQVGHDRTGRTQLAHGQEVAQPVGAGGGGRGNLSLAMGKAGQRQPDGATRQQGHELPAFESRVQVGGVFILMFHKILRQKTFLRWVLVPIACYTLIDKGLKTVQVFLS